MLFNLVKLFLTQDLSRQGNLQDEGKSFGRAETGARGKYPETSAKESRSSKTGPRPKAASPGASRTTITSLS